MPANVGWLTSDTTKAGDNLWTPFYAAEPIIKYLDKEQIIWCPFDEKFSAFYQLLTENGFTVTRSHLKEGQDFFEYEPEHWDIIVSNPPFSLKNRVLERLYSFNKPFSILLPLNSLQGISRYEFFKQSVQLLTFDRRISFHEAGNFDTYTKGAPFASAYFCRDVLPRDLIVEELVEYERKLK